MNTVPGLSWVGVLRLALVQASIGAVVVLTTSTLNRVMVVELAMPAALPGFLVAIHYFIQLSRPKFGHESDKGGRRTPWIVGGMALLGFGGMLAAAATSLMTVSPAGGVALATVAFLLIGAGVGACGTSLLVLLASSVTPERRAPAATITWLLMIASFAITATVAGAFLDPFSFTRLFVVTSAVSGIALAVTWLATLGLEASVMNMPAPEPKPLSQSAHEKQPQRFMDALRDVLAEPHTRVFGLFVFISMLAYSAQDLVLEPFAGAVFGLTPGESTQLGGKQYGGVLLGMILVALLGRWAGAAGQGVLRVCLVAGCLASAALLAALGMAGFTGPPWPLEANVFLLGLANGIYAVAAISSMMTLMSRGTKGRDGTRMGVFGASQAIAFGLGGLAGTVVVDLVRMLSNEVSTAYAVVFSAQAILFTVAAWLAVRMPRDSASLQSSTPNRQAAAMMPAAQDL